MDGLCNVTGADGKATIGGKQYTLTIPTAVDFGEMERHVMSLRGNPLKELASCVADYPADLQQTAIKAACDSVAGRPPRITVDELQVFSGSPDGIVYMLYMMLRVNHPEIDGPEKASGLLKEMNEAEQEELLREVMQLSAVMTAAKNLPSTEQATETTDPHESRGLESMST